MPRYFLNIHTESGVNLHDEIGISIKSRAELYRRMMSMALDLVDGMRLDDLPWVVEALDESGKIVCTMDLAIEVERMRDTVTGGSIRVVRENGAQTIRSLGPAQSQERARNQTRN